MKSCIAAISALLYTYAERVDNGDFEGVAQLFSYATIRSDVRPAIVRGYAETLELYRRSIMLYDGKPHTKHIVSNVMIDIDGDGSAAKSRSYFTVLQGRSELPLQPIVAGRYHDTFACTEGEWRFTDRFGYIDLLGNLRYHLNMTLVHG